MAEATQGALTSQDTTDADRVGLSSEGVLEITNINSKSMATTGGVVAVHGGAWDIPEPLWHDTIAGVKEAARRAYVALQSGGSAVNAVVAAVTSMEEDPVFDAGRGSVLTSDGRVEVSALVMEGKSLKAGAVAAAHNLLTPIVLARHIMDNTQHVMLAGAGAEQLAASLGLQQREDLITDEARRQLHEYKKYKSAVDNLFNKPDQQKEDAPEALADPPSFGGHDTVGCVALDAAGLLSCGTSTGGITGQLPGRVGDTPLVGCGGYADNTAGAVSTTGHGESITRIGLAHHIINNMRAGSCPATAADASLSYMLKRVGGRGGCVVLSRHGDVATPYTTARMPWAYAKDGMLHWGMNKGEHFSEHL